MTITILLVILLCALLFFQLGFVDYIKDLYKEPELFVIPDECSMIMNQLVHQIKEDGDCQIRCKNFCEIKGVDFYSSELIKREGDCYSCNCFCK